MNTQVGKTFGLALLVAVGILAVMFALGTFSSQQAGAAPSGTITIDPATPAPGAATSVTLTFTNDTNPIDDFETIDINLDGWGVPESIDASAIQVRVYDASDVFQKSGNPTNVEVSGTTIIIELNDEDGSVNVGNGEKVTIVIRKSAGLTAPATAGSYDLSIGTAELEDAVTVSASLSADPGKGGSGTEITLTGKALADGTGSVYAQAFNDADEDGKLDPVNEDTDGSGALNGNEDLDGDGNLDVAEAVGDQNFLTDVSVSDGAFEATINASDLAAGHNQLEIVDANGGGATATFQITGTMTITPESVNKGEVVKIGIADWIAAVPETVKIAGIDTPITDSDGNLDDPANTPTDPSDDVAFVVELDDDKAATFYVKVGGTIRLGDKTIVLFDASDTRLDSASIEITSLPLSISPSTAVAGQEITAEGSGFDTGELLSTIDVGGEGQDTLSDRTKVNTIRSVTGGSVTVTFAIPDGVRQGTKTVTITDDSGRIGEGELTVPKPVITLDPDTSRRDSVVEVSGTGFPANRGIRVDYGDVEGVASPRSDGSGNWTAFVNIPVEADIGEPATISAITTTGEEYSAEAEHTVPGAAITLSPVTARSGDMLTISGTGFPAYNPVVVKVGNTGDINTGTNTDGAGDFVTTIQLPALAPGTPVVKVTVDQLPVTQVITISRTAQAPRTTDTATAFADVTSLVRVWKYDNATQGWEFYDPDPALASAVDYMNAASGDIVWISVTEQETFQGSMLYPGWNTHVIQ